MEQYGSRQKREKSQIKESADVNANQTLEHLENNLWVQ
jgi:hypothetical protein